ncbi:hypothetical protein ABZS66_12340 [Dactylosporangium sp. NPDC005572]|uniref:hypothetical protein n=1 Tax=Dactylosporangium sp. NPDC005572 TaxID=3156889 RepID=UPI0033BCAC32
MKPTRTPLLLAFAAGLAMLAGCTGTNSAPSTGAATGSSSAAVAGDFQTQAMAAGREFSQCARQHNLPNFPDPVWQGGLSWPNVSKADLDVAGAACQDILRRLASIPQQVETPSAETLGHMRQFAACMREHGVADWPDPKADGTFPLLGTKYAGFAQFSGGDGIPQSVTDARGACIAFEVEWRIAAS